VSIGETLAESRRQAGLTVTQVSQQTRIRESIIRAIEQGDFSSCGGDFYSRGHIRSIAGVVGTDPAPLIREYDEEHGPPGAISAADVFQPSTPIKIRDPRPFPLGKVAAVVLVAAAGFGVYRFVSDNSPKAPARQAAEVRPTVTVTPTVRPTQKATEKPAYPPGEALISLTATQDCWVGITNNSGKQLYNGIVQAGKSMTWRENVLVSVRLGNPSGIKLTVDGKNETPKSTNPVTVTVNPSSTSQVTTTATGTSVPAAATPTPTA
jgi:cytoskeletal protein RodZ